MAEGGRDDPAVRVRGLTQVYGPAVALDGVDFDAHRGEIVGVLGPNGAGKTTLLETCVGLRSRTRGTVEVIGLDPEPRPLRLRERVTVQPQHAALMPELTARETLELWSSFYRNPLAVPDVTGPLGVEDFGDRRVSVLSGGQFQRLRIAMALLPDPEVVLLDEPSAGLDPVNRKALRRAVAELRGENRCVILSTHHMDEAEELCDRIVVVDGGRLAAEGPPSRIVAEHAPGCQLRFEASDYGTIADLAREHGFDLERRGTRGGCDLVEVEVGEDRLNEALSLLVGSDTAGVDIRRGDLEEAFAAVTGSRIDDEGQRKPAEDAPRRTELPLDTR
ncbi:ABC transporter ATP-binding protein [Nocardiopsis kunsanensis]|uniref:ABC transporter ATP-binding protein n=1 Tax=Nocardiopsis kunsanensis TaxID=141693 RepID=UPI00034D0CB3|nr:ABC transporter ATP-binding protein [Nocardiopsis kunsanensis]